jgi:hypothetical protein
VFIAFDATKANPDFERKNMLKRISIRTISLSLSTLAIFCLPTAIAQTQDFTNYAQAELRTTGDPLPDVDVSLDRKPCCRNAAKAKTDKNGEFLIKDLAPGAYVVVVNLPTSSNPAAKSYYESRSNTARLELEIGPKKTGGANSLVVDLILKEGKLTRVPPEGSTANRRGQSERESEITIEVGDGQSVSGKITTGVKRRA